MRFQQRIDIAGELIPLDPAGAPMSDAAWALENLARAKQTLANGYCGLPLRQTCPHPNACLTCDSFLTTAEFLPAHRDQLTHISFQAVAIRAGCRASGSTRGPRLRAKVEQLRDRAPARSDGSPRRSAPPKRRYSRRR